MTVTITLPEALGEKLVSRAEARNTTVDALAAELLWQAFEFDDLPTPEEVVAKIKATPPDLSSIIPAKRSLADALRESEALAAGNGESFDLDDWNRQWAKFERELKALDQNEMEETLEQIRRTLNQ